MGYIVGKFVEKGFNEMTEEAVKKDKENIDEEKVEQYEKDLQNAKTPEDVIKAGSDFFNDSKS